MKLIDMIRSDEKENGNLLFLVGIRNNLPSNSIESTIATYSSICGGFYEGVYQWATHDVSNIEESENTKYFGWIITIDNKKFKLYIEKKITNIDIKNDWKYAKNLFSKYLKIKH